MDNELFKALITLLDEKLESIKSDINHLKTYGASLKSDVGSFNPGRVSINKISLFL